MERIPITLKGYNKLREELERLQTVDRKEVVLAIQEARGHGDLSENAEYDAAKERQGMIEARINELESKMSLFDVIDVSKLSGDKVVFGSTVTLENLNTDETKTYDIVGSDEANIAEGSISIMSPIARAILGKQEGDDVTVQTPRGEVEYSIIKVDFKK